MYRKSSVNLLVSFLYYRVVSSSLNLYLEAIAGKGARINYADWFKKTCLDNRVALEGWPDFLSHNPKDLKISHLRVINTSLDDGDTFYREMSSEEVTAGFHAHNAQIAMTSTTAVQVNESAPLTSII